ncbi:hypothetical protein [Sinorhizobium meliloti]|nr:hypothetical protein [Sinorhizobium meliloti]
MAKEILALSDDQIAELIEKGRFSEVEMVKKYKSEAMAAIH